MNLKFRFALLMMFPCVLDAVSTLIGQKTTYWTDYSQVSEANPVAAWALTHHPLMFVFVIAIWIVAWVWIIYKLPQKVALFAAVVLFLSHTVGFITWAPRDFAVLVGSATIDQTSAFIAIMIDVVIASSILYCALTQWMRLVSLGKTKAKRNVQKARA